VKTTNYYDPNTIVPINNGSNPPTTVYQNQVPFPTSVTAGSSGKWFDTITYENGRAVATSIQTWAVTADTPTTLTLITNNKAYTSAGNQLLFNQTTWYRINSDNTLTSLRKNIIATPLIIAGVTGTTPSGGDQNIDEVYQQPFTSPTLNLNAAYTTQVKGGTTISGTIFGYCQGTRQQTFTPTRSGQTLSGAAALITNETETDSIPTSSNSFCKSFYSYDGSTSTPYYFNPTNVTPMSSGATQNGYPLGLVWSNQMAPPTSVTAGATGTLATYVNYTSNSSNPSGPTIPVEYGGRNWKIVPDSATTLLYIATDIAKVYGTDVVIYTSTTNYRLNANNTLTALYKQVQASNIATQGQGYQNIYETYNKLLKTAAAIDYDDMIAAAQRLLRAPGAGEWVRFKLDNRIDHVLVDEAQDTNLAQWDIIDALTEEFFAGVGARDVRRTLFVVGEKFAYSTRRHRNKKIAVLVAQTHGSKL
jgi:hypothetical protein